MEKIALPWGAEEEIELSLPMDWKVKGVLEPRCADCPRDLDDEVARALAEPIGAPRLRDFARGKKRAAVVVDDRTRPTPVKEIIGPALAELNAGGIGDGDITVVMALGTHRPMTEAEIAERVGRENVSRVKVINHDFRDAANLVPAGVTPRFKIPCSFNRAVMEADIIVSIGCIEAHETAGVGGGYKNFMPGVSGAKPIYLTHNHRFQKPPRISSSGMPKSMCRYRRAVDECGALLGPRVFIVNAVYARGAVAAVVAGDPIRAHDAGRAIYEELAEVHLPGGPADVVISDARPLDLDLRVSFKSCFNSAAALKRGGLFINVTRAPEGLGDLRLPEGLPGWTGRAIRLMPPHAFSPLSSRLSGSPDQAVGTVSLLRMLHGVKAFLVLTSLPGGFPALKNLGMEFFTSPAALMDRARQLKPRAEVLVLPHGGASFVSWDRGA